MRGEEASIYRKFVLAFVDSDFLMPNKCFHFFLSLLVVVALLLLQKYYYSSTSSAK